MVKKALVSGLKSFGVVALGASVGFAFTAPSSGGFAYDVYDIAVNQILKGPVGFVGGVASMVLGAISLVTGRYLTAIPAVLGGAILLKADALVSSLGYTIR
ncbi:MAG: hypothetical protein ACPLGZ_03555 [Candidatus Pelagibacter ubique]